MLEHGRAHRSRHKVLVDVEPVECHGRVLLPGGPRLPLLRIDAVALHSNLLLLGQHAGGQPTDERRYKQQEGGRVHLGKGDAASPEFNHSLDKDEAREHDSSAGGALRLGVALAATHHRVGHERADEREGRVEESHEGDDPHSASHRPHAGDEPGLAVHLGEEEIEGGRGVDHVDRRRRVLPHVVLDDFPVGHLIGQTCPAVPLHQAVDSGDALGVSGQIDGQEGATKESAALPEPGVHLSLPHQPGQARLGLGRRRAQLPRSRPQ
mmetsp:Transcript_11443/g.37831  ORF Transcript_11443/g.37831 Transcript_11443/m.37831 type:complete len:266 (-) Transcript_11443:160-957(-)